MCLITFHSKTTALLNTFCVLCKVCISPDLNVSGEVRTAVGIKAGGWDDSLHKKETPPQKKKESVPKREIPYQKQLAAQWTSTAKKKKKPLPS